MEEPTGTVSENDDVEVVDGRDEAAAVEQGGSVDDESGMNGKSGAADTPPVLNETRGVDAIMRPEAPPAITGEAFDAVKHAVNVRRVAAFYNSRPLLDHSELDTTSLHREGRRLKGRSNSHHFNFAAHGATGEVIDETEFLLRLLGIDGLFEQNVKRVKDAQASIERHATSGSGEPDELSDISAPTVRILDFGCGTGSTTRLLSEMLHDRGIIHGIEISRAHAARAMNISDERNSSVTYTVHSGISELPYRDQFFDAVIMQESALHTKDKATLFKDIFRVLRPGGVLAGQDWMMTDADISASDLAALIQPVNWALEARIEAMDDYKAHMMDAGFAEHTIIVLDSKDIAVEGTFDASVEGFEKTSAPSEVHKDLTSRLLRRDRLHYGSLAIANAVGHGKLTVGVFSARRPT
eukprot:g1869.t1